MSTVVTFRAIDGANGPEISSGLIWNIRTEAAGEIVVNDNESRQLLDIFPSTGLAEVIRVSDEATAEARFTVEDGAGPMMVTLVLPEFLPPASVSGPAEAPVGATIAVDWTGPNGAHDAIFVAAVGETDESHQGKAYTSDGTPAHLRLPMTPGRYEIRYVMNDGAKVLARAPITLVETGASLEAAATAPAGSELSVGWQGPDYDRDFIAIVPRGEDRRARLSYAYTGNGNPARFTAPLDPGAYDLIYVANDNGTTELARRPITIEAVRASLDAPTSAPAGATLTVGFTGGGGARDMITLARSGDAPGTYETYERVREGQSVSLDLPAQSGAYELRYVQQASGKAILARQPLEITPVAVTLTAPSSAPAGTRIEVGFDGPGYARDFIVFARPGQATNKRTETGYPRNGNPAAITTPDEPGAWELRYLLGGAYGVIAARQPFTVTAPE
ncbi:MAG TPA: hypothetical protein ENK80_00355 [Rhodobacterales bacterium]|nr:hypothetical protein [Rhodobacterales bacterium]